MWRRLVVTILMLVIAVIPTLPVRAQQKPFTEEQVGNMVRAGLGDSSGRRIRSLLNVCDLDSFPARLCRG